MLRNLWVMRHGLAEDQFESDFSRELSELGAKQAKSVANQIKDSSSLQPSFMLASPFARTQYTAEIVHQTLDIKEPFQSEESLVHFADHQLLGEFLLSSSYQDLIIISHMPIVSDLCSYLTNGETVLNFKTAQAVRIQLPVETEQPYIGKIEEIFLP
ncbi:MAG: histidine phosphatase family protein [Kangiellaceae bacterium]|nr:histidine phosphatase family protein [Kangiellaceae bacterium]